MGAALAESVADHLTQSERTEFESFRRRFHRLTGLDLGQYKLQQAYRRAVDRAARRGAADLSTYLAMLESDRAERTALIDDLTPNVTEFFRDLDRWVELKDAILPRILGAGRALKVWSAGCAAGAEPYSLAMLLDDVSPGIPHFLLATDIDRAMLDRASIGAFDAEDARNIPLPYRRYVTSNCGRYVVCGRIRDRVTFALHNLLSDPFETDFDLIACRNVVIYFTDAAKAALYERFHDALSTGGFLFVGGAERMLGRMPRGFAARGTGFYERID